MNPEQISAYYNSMGFNKEGKLTQVEYANRAVEDASPVIGVSNDQAAVLVALKKNYGLLADNHCMYCIDNHIGIAMAGMESDGRVLCNIMRTTSVNHKFKYEEPSSVNFVVSKVGEKMQECTQNWRKRPYGVGILVAGFDHHLNTAQLYYVGAGADITCWKAIAIGKNSEIARTYLEERAECFKTCDIDALIRHALLALGKCDDEELTEKNVSIGVVGKGIKFKELSKDETAKYCVNVKSPE